MRRFFRGALLAILGYRMPRSLPSLFALLLLVLPAAAEAQGARDTEGEAEMLARINALRLEASLEPLVRHAALDEAALVHSMDMAEHAMVAHVSPRTGDPAARVADAGARASRIAQNIALRRSTAEALISILESAPHRQQLLTPELTHVGLAAVQGARGMYVTQVVAELEGPTPLPPPALRDLRGAAAPRGEARVRVRLERRPSARPSARAAARAPEVDVEAEAELEAAEAALEEAEAALEEAAETPPAESDAELEAHVATTAGGAVAAPVDPRERDLAEEAADERAPSARPSAAGSAPPTIRLPYGARAGVAGYWVFYGGRWWFFRSDGRARPGAVLHADPSVEGPPPGYDEAGRPTAPSGPSRRPAFGWSPRRHYPLWRQQR